jgi:hypothetical protein
VDGVAGLCRNLALIFVGRDRGKVVTPRMLNLVLTLFLTLSL